MTGKEDPRVPISESARETIYRNLDKWRTSRTGDLRDAEIDRPEKPMGIIAGVFIKILIGIVAILLAVSVILGVMWWVYDAVISEMDPNTGYALLLMLCALTPIAFVWGSFSLVRGIVTSRETDESYQPLETRRRPSSVRDALPVMQDQQQPELDQQPPIQQEQKSSLPARAFKLPVRALSKVDDSEPEDDSMSIDTESGKLLFFAKLIAVGLIAGSLWTLHKFEFMEGLHQVMPTIYSIYSVSMSGVFRIGMILLLSCWGIIVATLIFKRSALAVYIYAAVLFIYPVYIVFAFFDRDSHTLINLAFYAIHLIALYYLKLLLNRGILKHYYGSLNN